MNLALSEGGESPDAQDEGGEGYLEIDGPPVPAQRPIQSESAVISP
jgi:hypothetical protein